MDRIGVGFWGGMAVNELIDCVSLADQKGYESAYLIESFADAFGVLSACARETSNIILGDRRGHQSLPATRRPLPPPPRPWMLFQPVAFDSA